MIAVNYHADLKEVQSDARLSALLSPAQQAAPFDRLEWWQGLASHCGLPPMLAVAREGDAIAVLPLTQANGHLAGLANWYTFRFRPLLSAEADNRQLLEAMAEDLAHRTHRITLSGLPDEDGSATALEQAFKAAGWLVMREECDSNHVLHVEGRTWEEYRAGLPGQLRTTLSRKSSKVDCEVLTRFDEDVWRAYEDIYAESWKPEEGSMEFLRALAETEGRAGRLRLGIARARSGANAGEPLAAQIWTIEGNTGFIHKLAHRESAKRLSPGSVLTAAMFRHAIDEDKVSLIDYGTGNDAYKSNWMEEVRPRYRLEMVRPLAPRNWPFLAKIGLRRVAGNSKHG